MNEATATVRTVDSEADVMEMLNDVLPGKSIPVFTITHREHFLLTDAEMKDVPPQLSGWRLRFAARWLAARRRR